jgi:hypothetical protein
MSKTEFFTAVKTGDVSAVNRFLDGDPSLIGERDDAGATAVHYGALNGQREVVRLLVSRGASINCTDSEFGATPAAWAIEYIRELGGMLAFEIDDMVYAVQQQDVRWVARILDRFPTLRTYTDLSGVALQKHAEDSGNAEIIRLFDPETTA